MTLKIVCAGFLARYPAGGQSLHHLQYLVGLQRLGQEVLFVEDYGWPGSCYDPSTNEMTDDARYGLEYLVALLRPHGLAESWCYLGADGSAAGMSRDELADRCRDADLYINLSNVNAIDEGRTCRRRVLVDTDPVFTQIGGHGLDDLASYDVRFTFGESIGRPGTSMPNGGLGWLPTRQPVVVDLWSATPADHSAAFTTVANLAAYGECAYEGRVFGHKDREFEAYVGFPAEVGGPFEIAVNTDSVVSSRLRHGGWRVVPTRGVTRDPASYQSYLRGSRGEFSVAKHAYVVTRCGWFSDRTTGYLASGRPAIVQDTGFTDFLPSGEGLLPFRNPDEARAAVDRLTRDYEGHCRVARELVEEHFDSATVLGDLLERSL